MNIEGGCEYREDQNQKLEMVVMLGASFRGLPKMSFEHFPLHLDTTKRDMPIGRDGLPKEVVGGDVRLRAIVQYVEQFKNSNQGKNIHIFTTGGPEKGVSDDYKQTSRALAARGKLINKHDLPEDLVTAIKSSGSTLGNAKALALWAKEHKDVVGKLETIKILTNEFHMTRAWVMFVGAMYSEENNGGDIFKIMSTEDKELIKQTLADTLSDITNGDHQALKKIKQIFAKYLSKASVKVESLVAEDILLSSQEKGSQKYAKLVKYDPLVQAARVNERIGIGDLLDGKYQVK